MLDIAATLLCTIFFLLSAVHIYWMLGGKWGKSSAIPTNKDGMPLFEPGIGATVIVAGGLALMGLLPLVKAGLVQVPFPTRVTDYGLWLVVVIFILRAIGEFQYVGFFKKVRGTQFAKMDTKFYSPLSLFISCLSLSLQLLA